jgi:hypothetical protein
MEMYLVLSYALALILMVLCILIFTSTINKKDRLGKTLIAIFGIYTGFGGVIWSLSLFFRDVESALVLGLLSPWLLLEVGAGQLSQVMKKLKNTEATMNDSIQGGE